MAAGDWLCEKKPIKLISISSSIPLLLFIPQRERDAFVSLVYSWRRTL
jgi:hypothetical protein